jgi:hypothetical protein
VTETLLLCYHLEKTKAAEDDGKVVKYCTFPKIEPFMEKIEKM